MIPRLSSLASRNLRARKARSLLTSVGIILGVAVVLAVAVTNASTLSAFQEMVDSLSGKSDLLVNAPTGKGMPRSYLNGIRRFRDVSVAAPGILAPTTLIVGSKKATLDVAGIEPGTDRKLRSYSVKSGRFLRTSDKNALLLVRGFADSHGIDVGQTVKMAGGDSMVSFRVVGLIEELGVGRFAGGDVAFTVLDSAGKLFAMRDRLSFVDVKATAGTSVPALERGLVRRFGDRVLVERPKTRQEGVTQTLRSLRIGLSFFGAIALFVGAFLIFNTLSMVVVERTRELGMLRSLGATRAQIIRLVLAEASAIGIIGSFIGLALGTALSRFLIHLVSGTLGTKISAFQVPPTALGVGLALGMLATVIGALQPAFAAGKVRPIAALRVRGEEIRSSLNSWRLPAAAIFVAIGLALGLGQQATGGTGVLLFQGGAFLVMLGAALTLPSVVAPAAAILRWPLALFGRMEARLAAGNVGKTRQRTAATAGAAMISLAMLISIGGMTESFKLSVNDWVDKSIGADVFISSEPVNLSINKSFTDKLRRVRGVTVVSPVRFIPARSGKRVITLRIIEPKTFRTMANMQFTEGSTGESWRRLTNDDEVFVASGLARSAKLRVGDNMRISTPTGQHSFRIAGVVLDFAGEAGEVVIANRRVMNKYFNLDDANLFRVKVAKGYRPAAVARRIKQRWGTSMSLSIRDIQQFRDEVNQRVNVSFASFNVIVLLAVLVAGIGIINTLTMNILERIREIGVLRAIGATRWQVRRMVVAEAAMTGAIGAAGGIALGIYMARVIVRAMQDLTGFTVTFTFPWQTIWISLAIVFFFATVASLYPARRAAGVNIVKAVQYE